MNVHDSTQGRDRLSYLGEGKWSQRAGIRREVLARWQGRDGSRAVTPESGARRTRRHVGP